MVVHSDPAKDTRVKKEAQSLTAAGHAVTVFGLKWPDKETDDPGRDDPRRDDMGFAIARPAVPDWADGPGAWNLLRRTASWYDRMRPLVDAAVASRPDVLHAHDLDTIGPASETARARGIPCVYDDHEASYVTSFRTTRPRSSAAPSGSRSPR